MRENGEEGRGRSLHECLFSGFLVSSDFRRYTPYSPIFFRNVLIDPYPSALQARR
jgi:hypothetical protein